MRHNPWLIALAIPVLIVVLAAGREYVRLALHG